MQEQHGVITRKQAFECGYSKNDIAHLLSSSEWLRLLPGTYAAAASTDAFERRIAAACFWAGEGSAAWGRTAAFLWQFDAFEGQVLEICTPP